MPKVEVPIRESLEIRLDLPASVHFRLCAEAGISGRSLSGEIRHRLAASLDVDWVRQVVREEFDRAAGLAAADQSTSAVRGPISGEGGLPSPLGGHL